MASFLHHSLPAKSETTQPFIFYYSFSEETQVLPMASKVGSEKGDYGVEGETERRYGHKTEAAPFTVHALLQGQETQCKEGQS